MKFSRGFLITLISILTLLTVLTVIVGPNGTGSIKRCDKLKSDLLALSPDQLKKIYGNSLNIVACEDGDVIGICDDSHTWFGGNMVVKKDDSDALVFRGHVCGSGFLKNLFGQFKAESAHEKRLVKRSEFLEHVKKKILSQESRHQ